MVKVTFSFDDKKWASVMKFTGAKTKTEAVNKAMKEYLENIAPHHSGEEGNKSSRKE